MKKIKKVIKCFFCLFKKKKKYPPMEAFYSQTGDFIPATFPFRQDFLERPGIASWQKEYVDILGHQLLEALGGKENIETYRESPHASQIRIGVVDPKKVNVRKLRKLKLFCIMECGDRMIYITP